MLNNRQGLKEEVDFLKKYIHFYLSFKGRLNRKSFALFTLELSGIVAFIAVFCISIGMWMILLKEEGGKMFMVIAFRAAFVIGELIICIAGSSAVVRRLHDLNLSGWWVLLLSPVYFDLSRAIKMLPAFERGIKISPGVDLIIGGVNLVIMIGLTFTLWFMKGTNGENKYGPDLLQMENINVPRISKKIVLSLMLSILTLFFIFYFFN